MDEEDKENIENRIISATKEDKKPQQQQQRPTMKLFATGTVSDIFLFFLKLIFIIL